MKSISRSLLPAVALAILGAAPAGAVTYIFAFGGYCATVETNGSTTQVTVGPCGISDGIYGPFALAVGPNGTNPTLPNSTKTSVIPQFVDGGGWQTTLVVSNTTASAATASLRFYQETAAGGGTTGPWNPAFLEGTSNQNLNLAPGATLFLHTPGTNSTLVTGWGQLTASDGVQIYSVFNWAGHGQGTAPGATIGNHVLVPYDNTNGNNIAIAIANPTSASETVTASFQSESGVISQSSLTIPANGHTAFLLSTLSPGTAGDHGQAEFYTASGSIALIGLQSNPSNFLTTAQTYPVSGLTIIGAHDTEACWVNPFSPPCPQPFGSNALYWSALCNNKTLQVAITPGTGGTYNAAVSGSLNGATVSGSFVGGTITNSAANPSPLVFAFTSVGQGSNFSSGSLNLALTGTAFDAAAGEGVGNVSGSITLANLGSSTVSGAYTELINLASAPAPALTFALQSRVAGTGNLSMAISNTGGAAATNVTITSITAITASGATFVYVPGLLNPPFVVPGAANLASGATSGFNLTFQATSGSAGTPFSFVINAKADNVAPFTTTINVQ